MPPLGDSLNSQFNTEELLQTLKDFEDQLAPCKHELGELGLRGDLAQITLLKHSRMRALLEALYDHLAARNALRLSHCVSPVKNALG